MNTAPLRHAIASALLLLGTAALAAPPAPPAPPAELAAKRAELDRLQGEMAALARRMADLSREVGGPAPRMVMHRMGEPRIGLGVVLGEAADGGARIAAVTPGGPAAKAGLKAGDIVRSVHGRNVASPDDLVAALRGIQKGQAVNVGYLRDGRSAAAAVVADELTRREVFEFDSRTMQPGSTLTADAFVGSLDDEVMAINRHTDDRGTSVERVTGIERETGRDRRNGRNGSDGEAFFVPECKGDPLGCSRELMRRSFRFSGLSLSNLDADLGRYFGTTQGVLVMRSINALPNLRSGDVIQAVEGKAVNTPRDVMKTLYQSPTGDKVTLRVLRNRAAQDIVITVPEGRPLDFLPHPPPAPPAPPAGAAPPAPPAPPTPPPPAGGTTPAI
ncbi:MAG: PDZ domain-containing protein [Lysobacteraceae bacterium]|jgi:membrane-associated protease RseP (regulator of RpoE activity)